jgi:hypothetical protein
VLVEGIQIVLGLLTANVIGMLSRHNSPVGQRDLYLRVEAWSILAIEFA